MVPSVDRDLFRSVRGVLEQIVLPIGLAGSDRVDLAADRDQRFAKTIQLVLRFAFRGLDHDRARHRPGNGRGVKAVIHQALGNVFDLDACALAGPQVENAFVCDEAVFSFEKNREMRVKPFCDVIGIQNRDLRCFR